MPLLKSPVATLPAPVAALAPAAEAPKKRSLKPKAAATPAAVDAAVESAGQAAAETVAPAGSLQPSDMKPEQKRIQRSGIWQAVVQSNALVQYAPTLDAFLDLVDRAADRGLQYVNRQ